MYKCLVFVVIVKNVQPQSPAPICDGPWFNSIKFSPELGGGQISYSRDIGGITTNWGRGRGGILYC